MSRMLLIRTGGLGDTLLLWPAVAGLRRKWPDLSMDLMGYAERLRPMVNSLGADRALDVEGSGLHLLFEMSAELPDPVRERFGEYDLVVVFAQAGDFALAENLSACGAGEVHAFLPFPPDTDPQHVADYVHGCLVQVDLAEAGAAPALPAPSGGEPLDAPVVLIAPGSGSKRKNWPASRFAQLIDRLRRRGVNPGLVQGPADVDAVQAVQAALPARAPSAPVLEDLTPHQLARILSRAELLIGNDSGVTHLAGLMHVPTVAVFGPSDPVRWRPLGAHTRVVFSARLDCQPCSVEEREACDQARCLENVGLDQVFDACERLLG